MSASVRDDDVVIAGWAATPAARVRAVVVTVDGEPVRLADLHLPTPEASDVGPATRWSPTAGWEARVSRASLPVGAVTIGALVVRSDDLVDDACPFTTTIPAREEGDAPAPTSWIDQPGQDEVVRPPFAVVAGWALDVTIDRVEIRFGAGEVQRARLLAEPRADLARLFDDDPLAPLAGWSIVADISPLETDAATTLYVDAVAGDRRSRLTERSVRVGRPTRRPVLDPSGVNEVALRAKDLASRHQPRADRPSLLVGTHALGLGGAQLYLHELLRHLLASGDVDCTVLSHSDGVLRDELEDWGARVHIVGLPTLTGAAYEQRMLEMAQIASLSSANVAIANTAGSFWMVDLATRLGIPPLWAVHESFPLERFEVEGFGGFDEHVRAQFEAAFAGASAVIFEADATANMFADVVPADRSLRIDYGIDLDRIEAFQSVHDRAESRRARGYADGDVVLLCLGTFEPRKSQGALCAAFARIVDRHPRARLALVGDTGSTYSQAVCEIVSRLGLVDRIALVPVTPDIDHWYHLADGFILASDIESLPRTMLEVMAFGVPVIGTAVFGIPELITDGVDGMLFEPRCLASLTAALDRFLTLDPDARRDLGSRARQRVVPDRDSRRYAAEYRGLIDGLLRDQTGLP